MQQERRLDRRPCEGGEGEASCARAPGPPTSDTEARWLPRARAAGTRRAPRLRERKSLAQGHLPQCPRLAQDCCLDQRTEALRFCTQGHLQRKSTPSQPPSAERLASSPTDTEMASHQADATDPQTGASPAWRRPPRSASLTQPLSPGSCGPLPSDHSHPSGCSSDWVCLPGVSAICSW
ncbi:PREDICTED: uncharacterized protein LOC102175041 isoform X1 [Capra hircus]|uniref:uncharacterized protein LOC102175041 isoform X1 n=1 Tax=Capra hircus TaxID=9925 RepID=UPI0008474533|nr:PREDICTED: uncharacterized protein LOC102175041 isoform X1 [Capra hircus]